MTKEDFAKKLKTLQFKKVVSVEGAKGYMTVLPTANKSGFGITCFAFPGMKAKRALDYAWDMMLRRLAREFDYKGDLTAFR